MSTRDRVTERMLSTCCSGLNSELLEVKARVLGVDACENLFIAWLTALSGAALKFADLFNQMCRQTYWLHLLA